MTLELVAETCAVCDRVGDLDTFHGLRMHTDCAPSHWVESRDLVRDVCELLGRKHPNWRKS